MAFNAADLKMVDDHIAQGEHHVTRQGELVAWVKERGHPTDIAEELLAEFKATLLQHRAHRELMIAERDLDPFAPRPRSRVPPKAGRSPKKD